MPADDNICTSCYSLLVRNYTVTSCVPDLCCDVAVTAVIYFRPTIMAAQCPQAEGVHCKKTTISRHCNNKFISLAFKMRDFRWGFNSSNKRWGGVLSIFSAKCKDDFSGIS